MSEELTSKEISVIEKKLKQQELTEITYKYILDQKPPKSIIRRNDYGKFDYLPITAVERLLDGLFKSWKAEILREGSVVNGFYIVVRLSAEIPNSDKILVADGIGFAEFQTTKGASPTDFTKLMPGAGVMAVPKAKSEAIKNAAKSFGNLFGRNLLRNDDQSEAEYNVVSLSRTKIANTLGATDEKD
jgi:predicted RecA/RadA family phage recombinase